MAQAQAYPYGENFQTSVLSLMLREPEFLASYGDIIRPEYFDAESQQELARIVTEYHDESGKTPDYDIMRVLVVDQKLPEKRNNELSLVLDQIYKGTITDLSAISERVVEFGKSKVMEEMLLELADANSVGANADMMWEKVDRYRTRGSANGTPGMDISDTFLRADEVCGGSSLFNPALKIGTGFPSLDKAFYGGLGRRELGIVLGYTGHGKSAFLINLGTAAVQQRLPVIHVSVGELEQDDLLASYASRWSQMTIHDIVSSSQAPMYKKRALEFFNKYKPRVRGKYFPPFTTLSTLRSFISRCKYRQGLDPALIIIDNADDLSSGRKGVGDLYEELGQVYIGLKSIAHDFDVAIWADSQTNRGGKNVDIIDIDVMSDSHKKARKADVIVSINRSKDGDETKMKLFIAKARRYSKKNSIVNCECDLSTMTIQEQMRDEQKAA